LVLVLRSSSSPILENSAADPACPELYAARGRREEVDQPSGSRNSTERLPHGCVVGSRTNLFTKLWSRPCSSSTSATSKSRIIERFDRDVAAPALRRSIIRWLLMARTDSGPCSSV